MRTTLNSFNNIIKSFDKKKILSSYSLLISDSSFLVIYFVEFISNQDGVPLTRTFSGEKKEALVKVTIISRSVYANSFIKASQVALYDN